MEPTIRLNGPVATRRNGRVALLILDVGLVLVILTSSLSSNRRVEWISLHSNKVTSSHDRGQRHSEWRVLGSVDEAIRTTL
jgi:hypothetical protein